LSKITVNPDTVKYFNNVEVVTFKDNVGDEDEEYEKMLTSICTDVNNAKVAGMGSQGTVFKLSRASEPKTVAVKVTEYNPLPNRNSNERSLEEVEKEWSKKFIHRHTLRFYSKKNVVLVDKEDEKRYFVLMVSEFFPLADLGSAVKKGKKINEKMCWSILKQLSEALVFMYAQNHHLHRDIKPGNVLIRIYEFKSSHIEVVLGDFGLTRSLHTQSHVNVSGTGGFLAPEAYNREFTTKTDIYALGITIISTLVCLEEPVIPHPQEQIGKVNVYKEPTDSLNVKEKLLNVVSPKLVKLLERMTATKPEERPTYEEIISLAESEATVLPAREESSYVLSVFNIKMDRSFIDSGVCYKVEGKTEEGVKIKVNGQEVLVSTKFLIGNGSVVKTNCSVVKKVIAPDFTLLPVIKGDRVEVLSVTEDGWLYCALDQEKGYIFHNFIELDCNSE